MSAPNLMLSIQQNLTPLHCLSLNSNALYGWCQRNNVSPLHIHKKNITKILHLWQACSLKEYTDETNTDSQVSSPDLPVETKQGAVSMIEVTGVQTQILNT